MTSISGEGRRSEKGRGRKVRQEAQEAQQEEGGGQEKEGGGQEEEQGTNCIKIGPGKLILRKRKGLLEVIFS